eukprot:3004960-Prymnesium_polylepis.2
MSGPLSAPAGKVGRNASAPFARDPAIAAHHMRKEYVLVHVIHPGSHDQLAALDVAQPSRHPLPRLVMATCIFHKNGDDRVKQLEQEDQQAEKDEEEEDTCLASKRGGS